MAALWACSGRWAAVARHPISRCLSLRAPSPPLSLHTFTPTITPRLAAWHITTAPHYTTTPPPPPPTPSSTPEAPVSHLDYKSFVARKSEMEQNIQQRHSGGDVNEVVSFYDQLRKELTELDSLLQRRTALAKQNRKPKDTDPTAHAEHMRAVAEEGVALKEAIKKKEEQLTTTRRRLHRAGSCLPNWCHGSVPVGPYENAKVVGWTHGQEPSPALAKAQSYMDIGAKYDLFDFETAAKVSGSRFVFLKNAAVFLELGLIQWAVRELASIGFRPVITPDVVRDGILIGTGFQPRPRDEPTQRSDDKQTESEDHIFQIRDTDMGLVGTAEAPLVGMFSDRIIENEELPIRVVGFSHCFRREAGSRGNTLYRLHQFSKVEMVCITEGSESASEAMLSEVTAIQKTILEKLGLHGRILELPTEDMGAPAYHKYDMEVWMPSLGKYGEVTSASNCLDYQSRRLNIRQREGDGGKRKHPFVHTINGTALAVPRIIISILEQCQDEKGRIVVPECLVPYVGMKYIE